MWGGRWITVSFGCYLCEWLCLFKHGEWWMVNALNVIKTTFQRFSMSMKSRFCHLTAWDNDAWEMKTFSGADPIISGWTLAKYITFGNSLCISTPFVSEEKKMILDYMSPAGIENKFEIIIHARGQSLCIMRWIMYILHSRGNRAVFAHLLTHTLFCLPLMTHQTNMNERIFLEPECELNGKKKEK